MNKIKNNSREFLSLLLFLIFIFSLFAVPWSEGVLHTGGLNTLRNMFVSLFNPAISPEIIYLAITSLWETFAYAVISISIAVVAAVILGFLASGLLINSKIVVLIARGFIGFLRAIHELVWAWLFVAAIGLNPLGGVFALAIPYSGYMGKIFADTLIEVPKEPIEALRITGAGKLQLFLYGYLPAAFPNMMSYTMYRLECAVRSSSVLSFIGLGGIGLQIQLSLQDLRYNEVWTFLFFLILLVFIIDKWSSGIRERIR